MRALLTMLGAAVIGAAACTPSNAERAAEAWRTEPLVDARTGAAFAIADFEGSVVVLEMMSAGCVACRIAQGELALALDALGDGVAAISVGVDPAETAATLAAYASHEGFGWRFAAASPAFGRSLADAFGTQMLSAPATPMVIVAPGGEVVDRHLGLRSAEALAAAIRLHLREGGWRGPARTGLTGGGLPGARSRRPSASRGATPDGDRRRP